MAVRNLPVRDHDPLEPHFGAVQLGNGKLENRTRGKNSSIFLGNTLFFREFNLSIAEAGDPDACCHVPVGLEEDGDVQGGDVEAEDVGYDALHLALIDRLVQVGHLERKGRFSVNDQYCVSPNTQLFAPEAPPGWRQRKGRRAAAASGVEAHWRTGRRPQMEGSTSGAAVGGGGSRGPGGKF